MRNKGHSTDTVMMLRPKHFGYNEQTAVSNAFQQLPEGRAKGEIHDAAEREFEAFYRLLQGEGVEVVTFDDTEEPNTPDAIFPNNWISTHEDGSIVLYPMEGANRRLERREEIVEYLSSEFGFHRVVDLTPFEKEGRYLEGTGSMVLDRAGSTVYACRSSRTDESVLREFSVRLGWKSIHCFSAGATTSGGTDDDVPNPIYHTNVMMALGETTAVICAEAIQDDLQRGMVMSALLESGRQIVEITTGQMRQFAGNMLHLRSKDGARLWVMSSAAFESLTPHQKSVLHADGSRLIHSPLNTIELVGGGSARCMLAEIFRPG